MASKTFKAYTGATSLYLYIDSIDRPNDCLGICLRGIRRYFHLPLKLDKVWVTLSDRKLQDSIHVTYNENYSLNALLDNTWKEKLTNSALVYLDRHYPQGVHVKFWYEE